MCMEFDVECNDDLIMLNVMIECNVMMFEYEIGHTDTEGYM